MGKIELTEDELKKAIEKYIPKTKTSRSWIIPDGGGVDWVKPQVEIWADPDKTFYPTTYFPNIPIFNPEINSIITGIDFPGEAYELNEEAPLEELTQIAKAIWEALWPDPFPAIRVIWEEDNLAPSHTFGMWCEADKYISVSFNNCIKNPRIEKMYDVVHTLIHELLHVRGFEHRSEMPFSDDYSLDKPRMIYTLRVEEMVNKLWRLTENA